MKLNVSALAGQAKSTKTAKAEKPALKVDPKVVDVLAAQLDEQEALEGSINATKAELVSDLFPQWLDLNASSRTHNGTVVLKGNERDIQMTFKSAFAKVPAERADSIKEAVGTANFNEFFRQKVETKISFDRVPEDKQQELFDRLAGLLGEMGIIDCLTLTNVIVPVDGFNEVRAQKLTVAQNEALEQVQKTVVSFRRAAGIKK